MPHLPPPLELTGTWRAAPADEALRRDFADPGLDDDGWEPIPVPGHWRSSPAFFNSDGPVLHRRRFTLRPPDRDLGHRSWLVLDGLFYQGDVWLDGTYVGDTEGYFVRHTFEVTQQCRRMSDHVLAVEVTCAPQRDRTAKVNLTGVFQHWDCLDPDWNPGGIWRPVRLETTGPVRARSLRVLCREATSERAVLALRAELDSDSRRNVVLRTEIAGHDDLAERPVAEGSNFVEWTVTVDRPTLWWPHSLGEQALHDLTVTVEVDGAISHTLHRRVGLRSITWQDWTLSVNGERLFLKGSNQGPSRMALAEATAEDLSGDVRLAVDAGLDLLRVHGHISRPELYAAADEQGLLLWQDMPLQWGYARGVRKQAVRQAEAAVDLLGHHPSIALWCGHNEPIRLDVEPGPPLDRARRRATVLRFIAGQQLPSWNKTVLDRSIRRALERSDRTRPAIAHSGVLPNLGSVGTDSHLYFGWYHGDERDLPGALRAWPRLARFVSEFGAQAVPESDGFMGAPAWPDLDWDRLARRHNLQLEPFQRHVPPAEHESYESWKAATQEYQATVVRRHIEELRRIKYSPTGGFCHFCVADGHPGVTWSVLDHERRPKAGYAALLEACKPVIVVADRLPATVAPGDAVALDVHVVSDRRRPLPDAVVSAVLGWAGGQHTWRWAGEVAADACVRVGTVQAIVPDAPGPLTLDLDLECGEERASNRYESLVVTSPS